MRTFLSFLILVTAGHSLPAQQQQSSLNPQGNIYAVVVGISKYGNGIPQLDFAHRDAQVFADYLRSKPGGSVPEDHIRLLLNDSATFSAIYDAFDWLLEICKENDLVYFYFSGHGDMENNTIYKLGFLLASNSPRFNYINNAVRIEDLNNIANTLSVKKKTRVILITDACHSGKLAGSDFKGNKLVGEQLKTIIKSEVRIASCEPDQLSNEDEGWGGGRGVFSYYLIKGLEGLADQQQDGIVTVNEIKDYLRISLANDQLLAEKINKQTPVIDGNANLRLARVDAASLNVLQQQQVARVEAQPKPMLRALPVQPQSYLFDLVRKDSIDLLADYEALSKMPKEQIPFEFIKMVTDTLSKVSLVPVDQEKIALLIRTLRENGDALKRFNEKLVVTLSDRGQQIINWYLNGDAAELERRRYYNSYSNGYDVYPHMFAIALKLASPEHQLYKILQVKYHYFKGVAARLKIHTVDDPKPLLDLALAEQKQALKLEENAAYIQMELGTLSDYNNDFSTAEKYYLRATEIAPKWAIPWSNLVGIYVQTKKFDKAFEASKKAIELQKDFQGTYINTGVLYQRTGNLLMAEELFQKSIKMNSRHYLPFEGLGYVYLDETQYELADVYFQQAEQRKQGFRNPRLMKLPKPVLFDTEVAPPSPCININSDHVGKNDILGHFALGIAAFYYGKIDASESEFRKVIALDNNNPLAFHYLGRILRAQQRFQEAELVLNYAVSSYMNDSLFQRYFDSLAAKLPATGSAECILYFFRSNYYAAVDDHYLLADVHESGNHFSEAEAHYRKVIEMNPEFIGGYYKLWLLLERLGRYHEAENMIRRYEFYDKDISSRELISFYNRMINRFPESGDWYYKAGSFLHDFASQGSFVFDRKEQVPDFDTIHFVNPMIGGIQRSAGVYIKFLLPGTKESIVIADKIFRPFTNGIRYLEKADSLIQDNDEMTADISHKIGDMYNRQNLPEKAMPYYRRSLELKPDNANTRIKLIETYSAIYYLGDALTQLDSLSRRKEINFAMQLLMAKYCIHAGRFDDAASLLKSSKQMHPLKVHEITDLNGRLNLISNKPKEALTLYKEYLLDNPGDSMTMYTISRVYAKLKNKKEAFKWLKMSVDNGFGFYYVLKQDPAWNGYRDQSQWDVIVGR